MGAKEETRRICCLTSNRHLATCRTPFELFRRLPDTPAPTSNSDSASPSPPSSLELPPSPRPKDHLLTFQRAPAQTTFMATIKRGPIGQGVVDAPYASEGAEWASRRATDDEDGEEVAELRARNKAVRLFPLPSLLVAASSSGGIPAGGKARNQPKRRQPPSTNS